MSRWIAKNASLMLLSLLLAFFFWAVATEAEDPTSTMVFSPAIPVEIRGLQEEMTAYGAESARVRVEIQAPKSVWDQLQVDDIHAYVDLTNGQTGTRMVPVQVSVGLEPSSVTSVTCRNRDYGRRLAEEILSVCGFGKRPWDTSRGLPR